MHLQPQYCFERSSYCEFRPRVKSHHASQGEQCGLNLRHVSVLKQVVSFKYVIRLHAICKNGFDEVAQVLQLCGTTEKRIWWHSFAHKTCFGIRFLFGVQDFLQKILHKYKMFKNKCYFILLTQKCYLMPVEFGVVNFLNRARLEFVDQPVKKIKTASHASFTYLLIFRDCFIQVMMDLEPIPADHLAESGNEAWMVRQSIRKLHAYTHSHSRSSWSS